MNYEQEYKNAFEAAKGLHDAGNALTKKQMEIVFPQLAESGDEKIRKFLIDYFTSYKIGNVATKLNGYRIDDILSYLEKQKEQKPAEWSEEDEDMLNSCISSIEEAKENRYAYKETDGDTSYDHEIAWLKSLRPVSKESLQPHWKPSEEQMKALDKAIPVCIGVVGRDEVAPLESLYEQLKKL